MKSGSNLRSIPFSSGPAPSGAKHVGSGDLNPSYVCNASLNFTNSWSVIFPILVSGLNLANLQNSSAAVGPTL